MMRDARTQNELLQHDWKYQVNGWKEEVYYNIYHCKSSFADNDSRRSIPLTLSLILAH